MNIYKRDPNDSNKVFRNLMLTNTFVFFSILFIFVILMIIDFFTNLKTPDFEFSEYATIIGSLAIEQSAIMIAYFKAIKDKEIAEINAKKN